MIEKIEIERFKGIKYCKIADLAQINLLIGRNNQGKSSVLESLLLASTAFLPQYLLHSESKISYLLNRRCERGLSWDKAKDTLWYLYDPSEPICVNLYFEKGRGYLPLRVYTFHEHPLVYTGDYRDLYYNDDYDLRCIACGGTLWNSEGSAGHAEEISEPFTRFETFMEGIKLVDSGLIKNFELVEKALWSDLVKKRLDKLVVHVLREGYEMDIEDLTYVLYEEAYQLAVKLPYTTIRVDDLGDGARCSLLMAMVGALSRDTALLLEEPETHQHPAGIIKTLEMLLKLTKENNLQLFISTHSIEFIRIISALCKDNPISIRSFFLERDKEGTVDARSIEPEDAEILDKLGLDTRFVYAI